MYSQADPLPEQGERNVLCPHYGGCLDHALFCSWHSWSCSRCRYRLLHEPIPDWASKECVPGTYELSIEIPGMNWDELML
jgi:hypothetical protein